DDDGDSRNGDQSKKKSLWVSYSELCQDIAQFGKLEEQYVADMTKFLAQRGVPQELVQQLVAAQQLQNLYQPKVEQAQHVCEKARMAITNIRMKEIQDLQNMTNVSEEICMTFEALMFMTQQNMLHSPHFPGVSPTDEDTPSTTEPEMVMSGDESTVSTDTNNSNKNVNNNNNNNKKKTRLQKKHKQIKKKNNNDRGKKFPKFLSQPFFIPNIIKFKNDYISDDMLETLNRLYMNRENFKFNIISQQNKTAGVFAHWVISQVRLARYKKQLTQVNEEVKTLRAEISRTQEEELQKWHSNKNLFDSTHKNNQDSTGETSSKRKKPLLIEGNID
ncbi:BTB/POZ domain-containing protein, partial [Reticulomyxa filosa]